MAIHMPSNALFTFKFRLNKWKLNICRSRWSCL